MAVANTSQAIGAVSDLLTEYLHSRTGLEITVGRPQPTSQQPAKRLNLFLYEASFDASLKNVSLSPDRPAPLWLVLKYLITPFDDDKESDTFQAHEYLGLGLRALQELSFFRINGSVLPWVPPALKDNPEELKITFDEVNADLLSKVMQGADEKYRFSMGFQIRPIMIVPDEPTTSDLLVGMDYTQNPAQMLEHQGEKGVQVAALASLGAQVDKVVPEKFEVDYLITIAGRDFAFKDSDVMLGDQSITLLVNQSSDQKLVCQVDGIFKNGVASAGCKPLTVVQKLANNRKRASDLVAVHLLPTLTQAHFVAAAPYGRIVLQGYLLGTENDDVMLVLYQDGKNIKLYDTFTYAADQTQLTLVIPLVPTPVPGKYRVILKVNNEQARNSPEVALP